MNTVKKQIRFLIEVYELATDKQIKEFEMAFDTQEDADVWAREHYQMDSYAVVSLIEEENTPSEGEYTEMKLRKSGI